MGERMVASNREYHIVRSGVWKIYVFKLGERVTQQRHAQKNMPNTRNGAVVCCAH
jgi:hypothetical protein